MRLRRLWRVCAGTFFTILSVTAFGQNALVSGTVTDPQDNAVAGAKITLTNKGLGTSRTVSTTSDGTYQIPQVAPGLYQMRVEAQGFKSLIKDDVEILVNTPLTLNLAFTEVGGVSETVTVTGGESTLNTTDATIGNTFESTRVRDLPLLSRNVVGLLSLQPGVTAAVGTDDVKAGGYVNGARSDQSNVTLDGVDVNEQQGGAAFFSVLRSTPDSLQEFRVTTTNPNADQGRSSGAQVSLVTKSGTNDFHGSLYEYHRNTITSANDWFNNKSGVERPALIRNNFGGSIGGPIKRDRAFFFFNYEGFREAKGSPVVREVPLPTLGQGIVRYVAATGNGNDFGSCPAGTAAGVNCVNRAQISAAYLNAYGVDPGTNSAALAVLADAARRYPANDYTVGDSFRNSSGALVLLNTAGYRFNASLPVKQNTYIARFDLNATDKHNLFARFNYQNDTVALASRFPDTPSPTFWGQPKGFVVGDAWTVSNSFVNNFRYGLTREAFTQGGDSQANNIFFRFIFSPFNFTRALSRVTPVHNIVDDLSYTKGSHGLQFGTNIRLVSNQRTSFGNSFDTAIINPSYYDESGAVLLFNGNRTIFTNGGTSDDLRDALASVIGRYTQYSANLNYARDGSLLPAGTGIKRNFKTQEYDFYAQDSWRARPNLTITYGLRHSTSTPVYEADGLQVAPTQSLGKFFEQRVIGANTGKPYNEPITIDLAGKVNNRPGFYRQDWNNFAPSISVAWSPGFKDGLLNRVFGEGRTTLRGGFRVVYDRIGSALAVSFNNQAILGFSSSSQISANTFTVARAADFGPLYTGPNQNVRSLERLSINNSLRFPLQHPLDQAQRIESGLDNTIVTPHSYAFNVSLGRDLGKGYSFEASYVGRIGRNLLVSRDVMHQNNLRDPISGMDFYTAMRQLIALRNQNTPILSVQKIPYFENILPRLATSTRTATQSAYRRVARFCVDNQFDADGNCIKGTIGGVDTLDHTFSQFRWDDGLGYGNNLFFHPQYAAFGALSSIGTSDYHAFQASFRKRFSNDLTFDFNYTLGHSLDIASGLEPSGSTISGSSLILNPLDLNANRGNSDFDIRHIINANYNYLLPFGAGRRFLGGTNSFVNAFLGGWQTTGIFRWNSGLPAGQPFDDGRWATNWNVQSNLVAIRPVKSSPTRTGDPNLFADPVAAYASYRNPFPGEAGDRNILREPGYVSFDLGLYKAFNLPWEGKRVVFRWEVFNLTNTQRFTDVSGSGFGFGQDPFTDPKGVFMPSEFGNFTGIQGSPRQMQFALRVEF
jgi:hypothetical protein